MEEFASEQQHGAAAQARARASDEQVRRPRAHACACSPSHLSFATPATYWARGFRSWRARATRAGARPTARFRVVTSEAQEKSTARRRAVSQGKRRAQQESLKTESVCAGGM